MSVFLISTRNSNFHTAFSFTIYSYYIWVLLILTNDIQNFLAVLQLKSGI